MKRALPDISWQNIAPPYLEYDYFQGHERFPFQPRAEEFSLVNAWWLAEAATLVYAGEAFVRTCFAQAGFPELRYFDGESTDCFIAGNDRVVILVFRGTESRPRPGAKDSRNIWADVKTDLDALLVSYGEGMKVHQGFQRALDEVWQDLSAYLDTIYSSSRPLWMTGHSLGAALATLAAERYRKVQGLYTFGSPRVGDKRFREHFAVKTYRFVYNNDIVTELPPPGLYFHVGQLCYIDSHGKLHHNSKLMDMLGDGIRSEARNIRQALEDAPSREFRFIPGGIKDHLPLFYALHLWNAIQESTHGSSTSS
jgi:pimeloyl-ACP methyl ester carboxylesterase